MVSISKEVCTTQYCLEIKQTKFFLTFNTGFHIYLIGGFQKYEHNLNLTMDFWGKRQILPDWSFCRGRYLRKLMKHFCRILIEK